MRDRGTAPLAGVGTVTVTDEGLAVRAQALRTTLATLLSGGVATVAMVGAVVVAMLYLDDWIKDGGSLEHIVAMGTGALVGSFAVLRPVAVRVLPTRPFQVVIPYRYLVSASASRGIAWLTSTHRPCSGRIAFRTVNPDGLVEQVQRAKAEAMASRSCATGAADSGSADG